MPADDNLRGMFDQFGSPEPTDKQREAARRNLQASIRREAATSSSWWRAASLRWSAATVVAAAVIAFVLFVPSSTREVDANLANIAAAARTIEFEELPEGSYLYYRIESTNFGIAETELGRPILYRLPTVDDIWVRGTTELRQTTAMSPIFFSAGDEEAYYASNLPLSDGIGETRTVPLTEIPNEETTAGLSTDPNQLWRQIVMRLSQNDEFTPDDEDVILDNLLELLGPRLNAAPPLRAALIELIGRLDVSTSLTASGSVLVLQFFEDEFGSYERRVEFDTSGFLLREVLIVKEVPRDPDFPIGPLSDLYYSRPSVVPEPGVFPAR